MSNAHLHATREPPAEAVPAAAAAAAEELPAAAAADIEEAGEPPVTYENPEPLPGAGYGVAVIQLRPNNPDARAEELVGRRVRGPPAPSAFSDWIQKPPSTARVGQVCLLLIDRKPPRPQRVEGAVRALPQPLAVHTAYGSVQGYREKQDLYEVELDRVSKGVEAPERRMLLPEYQVRQSLLRRGADEVRLRTSSIASVGVR